jgi:hypothetical protein
MSTEPQIPNLHDSILLHVRIDWEDAVATIEMEQTPGINVALAARGLRAFELTHQMEWGPSVCVNSAEVRMEEGGAITLLIEMQSGDTIRVVSEELQVL